MNIFSCVAEYMMIAWICSGRVIWPLDIQVPLLRSIHSIAALFSPFARSPVTNDPILIPYLRGSLPHISCRFFVVLCIFLLPSPLVITVIFYHVQIPFLYDSYQTRYDQFITQNLEYTNGHFSRNFCAIL